MKISTIVGIWAIGILILLCRIGFAVVESNLSSMGGEVNANGTVPSQLIITQEPLHPSEMQDGEVSHAQADAFCMDNDHRLWLNPDYYISASGNDPTARIPIAKQSGKLSVRLGDLVVPNFPFGTQPLKFVAQQCGANFLSIDIVQ